ncbi:HFL299Cp [Eremothecium sinecaudum]|uniref:HFL299Cp n=1 Tax=Eremothecium sinecaudum TaxID=45286 RepID=A0A109UXM0_9SACH|nr:HFL299Cp [Eremothecium sinecaudum]AMD21557.1 HFL299Cp [Eremothecium sinecaudum]
MAVEEELDQIIGEGHYRRRDLRNGLASRMGLSEASVRQSYARDTYKRDRYVSRPPQASTKRVRFVNLPLDTRDEEIMDMVREFNNPTYSRFYDHDGGKTAIFEFENSHDAEKCVERFSGTEIAGHKIEVEIFEQRASRPRIGYPRRQRLGDRIGKNHSTRRFQNRPPHRPKSEMRIKESQPNLEKLDAELDAYMNGE